MRVETIVVVMATAVAASIAHVSRQQVGVSHAWTGVQKNAATGVAGANVAGYGPERPSFVDDSTQCRRPEAPFSIPYRGARGCVPVRRRGAVSHDGPLRSFGFVQRARRCELGRLYPGRRVRSTSVASNPFRALRPRFPWAVPEGTLNAALLIACARGVGSEIHSGTLATTFGRCTLLAAHRYVPNVFCPVTTVCRRPGSYVDDRIGGLNPEN